jgi:hypothetical protein
MSVPVVPVRCCKLAVAIERDLACTTVPSPPRRPLFSSPPDLHTGTAVANSTTSGTSSPRAGDPGIAGEIDWLWVQPAYPGADIERRLAEAAVDWLRQRDARAIFKMEDAGIQSESRGSLGFKADVIRLSLYE